MKALSNIIGMIVVRTVGYALWAFGASVLFHALGLVGINVVQAATAVSAVGFLLTVTWETASCGWWDKPLVNSGHFLVYLGAYTAALIGYTNPHNIWAVLPVIVVMAAHGMSDLTAYGDIETPGLMRILTVLFGACAAIAATAAAYSWPSWALTTGVIVALLVAAGCIWDHYEQQHSPVMS